MSEPKRRGCAKNGCLGCLGVLGLLAVVSLVLGGLQLVGSRRPVDNIVEEKSQRLPPLPLATAAQLEDASGVVVPTLPVNDTSSRAIASGTLDLDLQMGEFTLVPGEPGSEITVEAEYDRSRFRLVEELTEGRDGNWTYKVRLLPRLRILGISNRPAKIEISVPKGRPMSVVGRVRMGQSDFELGGLWLEEVDLEANMGQHTLSFSEPSPAPAESFRLRGQMGQIEIRDLGNASPRSVEVSHRMGEMSVGLEGQWENDGEVAMRCQMGECSLSTPGGVRILAERTAVIMGGKSIRLPDPSTVPDGAHTLRLDVRGSMGEVRVR